MPESWITNNSQQPSLGPAFLWDCLGQCARAALLGLTPSLMHRHPIQGSTHVSSTQKGTGNSPHISAKQRLLWSQAAEPGASSRHGTQGVAGCLQVHLPRVLGSMGNESPEASCVLSPTPPVPKHWWHLDQNQKKETMLVLSAVPALTSPDSSVGVLTEEPR